MDPLACFSFESAIEVHVAGDANCRGCASPPPRCQESGCAGLIHSQKCAHGDEHGVQVWTETVCDVCQIGKADPVFWSPDEIRASWDRREQDRERRDEERRRTGNPAPAEIVADWIQASEIFFAWAESADPYTLEHDIADFELTGSDAIDLEGPATANTDPYWQWRGSGRFPRLRDLKAAHASGDLQGLFQRKLTSETLRFHAEIFEEFRTALTNRPAEASVRAAAISFYWQLSTLHPSYDVLFSRYDPHTGDYEDDYFGETDDSEKWDANRRIFSGYLAQIVRLLELRQCVDWEQTKWEIMNAYAAQDWDMARALYRHARQSSLLPEPELIAIWSHFEYLVVYGAEIDFTLGLGPSNENVWDMQKGELRQLVSVVDARKPFSLGALASPPVLFKPESLDTDCSLNEGRYLVPILWGQLSEHAPLSTPSQSRNLTYAAEELAGVIDSLGSSSAFYRSILAQWYEATGRPDLAALEREKITKGFKTRHISESHFPDYALVFVELCETVQKRHRVKPEHAERLARTWPIFEQLSSSTKLAWVTAVSQGIIASGCKSEVPRTACLRIAALYYAKAVEAELRNIFAQFSTKIDPRKSTNKVESLNGDGGDRKFYRYLTRKQYHFGLGDMITVLTNSARSTLPVMRDFESYLRQRSPSLLKLDVRNALYEVKEIGNCERHSDLAMDRAQNASDLARRVIEAMLAPPL